MTDHKKDIWLKVFCPDDACLAEEERFEWPTSAEQIKRSFWLEVFCPQSSCEITSPSQLP